MLTRIRRKPSASERQSSWRPRRHARRQVVYERGGHLYGEVVRKMLQSFGTFRDGRLSLALDTNEWVGRCPEQLNIVLKSGDTHRNMLGLVKSLRMPIDQQKLYRKGKDGKMARRPDFYGQESEPWYYLLDNPQHCQALERLLRYACGWLYGHQRKEIRRDHPDLYNHDLWWFQDPKDEKVADGDSKFASRCRCLRVRTLCSTRIDNLRSWVPGNRTWRCTAGYEVLSVITKPLGTSTGRTTDVPKFYFRLQRLHQNENRAWRPAWFLNDINTLTLSLDSVAALAKAFPDFWRRVVARYRQDANITKQYHRVAFSGSNRPLEPTNLLADHVDVGAIEQESAVLVSGHVARNPLTGENLCDFSSLEQQSWAAMRAEGRTSTPAPNSTQPTNAQSTHNTQPTNAQSTHNTQPTTQPRAHWRFRPDRQNAREDQIETFGRQEAELARKRLGPAQNRRMQLHWLQDVVLQYLDPTHVDLVCSARHTVLKPTAWSGQRVIRGAFGDNIWDLDPRYCRELQRWLSGDPWLHGHFVPVEQAWRDTVQIQQEFRRRWAPLCCTLLCWTRLAQLFLLKRIRRRQQRRLRIVHIARPARQTQQVLTALSRDRAPP